MIKNRTTLLSKRIEALLFSPVEGYSLAIFRVLFGIIMFVEFRGFYGYFIGPIQQSRFYFTYDFFHWVKLLDVESLAIMYIILFIALFFFIIGFKYRIASIIIFLGHSYEFLVDKGHYNNHYYFYCLILFWFCVSNANAAFSIDRWLSKEKGTPTIPRWQLLGFQLQIFVVYFMGGLAKLNYDWLQGYPLRLWLYDNAYKFQGHIHSFLKTSLAAILLSYAGLVLDLTIGFLLFFRRTKFFAIIPIFLFHFSNYFLWSIGTFPWAMFGCTILFFSLGDFKKNYEFTPSSYSPKRLYKLMVVSFFSIWFAIQFFLPLRGHLFKGHPAWTGEGHFFAWRMMLIDVVGGINIKIEDDELDYPIDIYVEDYVIPRQLMKAMRTPTSFISFCHYLEESVEEEYAISDPVVKLEIWKSINERTPILLNDTSLDYSLVNYKMLQSADWFTPWEPTTEPPIFSLNRYENWDDFLETSHNPYLYF